MRLGPADLRQETEDSYIAYTLNRVLTALHAQVQLALNYEAKRHLSHSNTVQQPTNLLKILCRILPTLCPLYGVF
jgi:serine O-acetyltransferase